MRASATHSSHVTPSCPSIIRQIRTAGTLLRFRLRKPRNPIRGGPDEPARERPYLRSIMIKTFVVLVVLTTIAAFTAVIFSLDAVSAARDEQSSQQSKPAATTAATHDNSTQAAASGSLTSFAGAKPDNAEELAAAHKP